MTTALPPPPGAPVLLQAIAALVGVLERENAALKAADRAAVQSLAEEKRLACSRYEEAARAPGAGTEPTTRDALRRALHRLADASAENRRRLAAALAAHHRLMQLIAEAVRAQQPPAGGYARGGAPATRARQSSAPMAFSFDRAL